MKQANASPRYKSFIEDRDKALERLHTKAQLEMSDVLRGTFQKVMHSVSHFYRSYTDQGFQTYHSQGLIKQVDHGISSEFLSSSLKLFEIVVRLRRHAFMLSFAGEAEAMARATDGKMTAYLSRQDFDSKVEEPSPGGGHMLEKIQLYMDRVKRRILDAVQMSAVLDEWPQEALLRVQRSLPKTKRLIQPPRILKKPVLEAVRNREADDGGLGVTLGITKKKSEFLIDPQEWDEMRDEYLKDFVPSWRGPESVIGVFKDEDDLKKEWYAWELEQEITQDFVQQVRDGQVQAAKDNGVKDFIWIAIIDDKTDECCSWRDGLTSEQIEAELKTKRKDDECQAIVPPAHFNCRCTLAPILEGMPETPPSNIGEFEEWLNP
jgi:SPP1 gp7 family putative phage head morphogenesis protein